MEQYIIRSGNPLVGDVTISGAKNATLGILAASIMADDDMVVDNLPDVRDINVPLEAIQEVGARIDRTDRRIVKIDGSNISEVSVDNEYIHRIYTSYCFIGALLSKYKSAQVPLPEGCNIGSEPVNQHIRGFRALGAEVTIERRAVIAHAIDLVASHIYLNVVFVGTTINIMIAAALTKGQTILENTAKGSHIVDVANFLSSVDANIKGAGIDTIHIRDVNCLHGTEYFIIPDQIEADAFMCTAAATRGDIMVKDVIPKHLETISAKLMEMGCEMIELDDAIHVMGKPSQRHTDIKTLPYPGFPADMQPQMSVALVLVNGTNMVMESTFRNRFKYVGKLARMGSDMKIEDNVAVIDGVKRLIGAQVGTPDLRAGAALVIAGLTAGGYTVVDEIDYVQRGYECFGEKLQELGAMIEKVDPDREIQKFKLRAG